MMIKAVPLNLSSLYSPSSSFPRMVRKPTKRIMQNLRSWDPLNSQLPDQEQERVKRTTWTPGEEILFWFGFHFDFDLCLPAKVKKKEERPLCGENSSSGTDLMTVLATALMQAAGRGWERCQCWKKLPRQPWCKRQCWHRCPRVGKTAAWNAQEARKTGSGLGKGRGGDGGSCMMERTWCNNKAQERTRHPPTSRIADSSMQQFTHLGVPYTHSKPRMHTGQQTKYQKPCWESRPSELAQDSQGTEWKLLQR